MGGHEEDRQVIRIRPTGHGREGIEVFKPGKDPEEAVRIRAGTAEQSEGSSSGGSPAEEEEEEKQVVQKGTSPGISPAHCLCKKLALCSWGSLLLLAFPGAVFPGGGTGPDW